MSTCERLRSLEGSVLKHYLLRENILYRSKKYLQLNQNGNTKESEQGYFYRLMWIFRRVARTLGLDDKPDISNPLQEAENSPEPLVFPARYFVLSDTDNDVSSTENSLRFTGILNGIGEFKDNSHGIDIFHTGDLVDKKNPDLSVVEYWRCFQQKALAKGYKVKLIAGNHEQEIWQNIRAGKTYEKSAKQLNRLTQFIESLDLFHVAGPVLFIHGYPTLEFLRVLLHFREVTGKDLNCFNVDHYKKAFKSINALKQYSYAKQKRQTNYLLYELADARRYYSKQGRAVGVVLEKLKIGIVVHGHRPQRSGVQVDYEFGHLIPNVRMIGNDTMVKRNGIGATAIGETQNGELSIVFVNKDTESDELQRKIRETFSGTVIPPGKTLVDSAPHAL